MKYIGIAAYSGEPSPRLRENVDQFIDSLKGIRDRIYIVLGGYWGLMKYIADRAIEYGIRVVFTLPLNPPQEPPNNEYTVIIRSDLGFVSRSMTMIRSSDILVAMGGGIGSILEIAMAYDTGIPIIIVESGMATDKVFKGFGEYLDERRKSRIIFVRNGVEAYKEVIRLLSIVQR